MPSPIRNLNPMPEKRSVVGRHDHPVAGVLAETEIVEHFILALAREHHTMTFELQLCMM
jgi:hypothetical protein